MRDLSLLCLLLILAPLLLAEPTSKKMSDADAIVYLKAALKHSRAIAEQATTAAKYFEAKLSANQAAEEFQATTEKVKAAAGCAADCAFDEKSLQFIQKDPPK